MTLAETSPKPVFQRAWRIASELIDPNEATPSHTSVGQCIDTIENIFLAPHTLTTLPQWFLEKISVFTPAIKQ